MYSFTLEDDQVDAIFKRVLLTDYRSLCRDIESIRAKDALSRVEKEDLDFDVRIVEAMKIVFEYYFSESDQKEIIGG